MTQALCGNYQADVVGRPLFRCAASVASNDRASGRGRSKAGFIAKLGLVAEGADECCFWLEMMIEGGTLPAEKVDDLRDEANPICAMMVASRRSAQNHP